MHWHETLTSLSHNRLLRTTDPSKDRNDVTLKLKIKNVLSLLRTYAGSIFSPQPANLTLTLDTWYPKLLRRLITTVCNFPQDCFLVKAPSYLSSTVHFPLGRVNTSSNNTRCIFHFAIHGKLCLSGSRHIHFRLPRPWFIRWHPFISSLTHHLKYILLRNILEH